MGWKVKIKTKFVKKGFKAVKKAVKSAVKHVTSFVEKIGDVVSKALQDIWKKVVVPVLEGIMNFLGIKDEEVLVVAANTQPLFKEEVAFLARDDVYLRNTIHDGDIFEAIKEVILEGRHNDLRGFYRYGDTEYYMGLPDINYGVALATEGQRKELLTFWQTHCDTYGFSNPFTKVDELPISKADVRITTTDIYSYIMLQVTEIVYAPLQNPYVITDGTLDPKTGKPIEWEMDWDSYIGIENEVGTKDEPDDIPNIQVTYTVEAAQLEQYFEAMPPVLSVREYTVIVDVESVVEVEKVVSQPKLDPDTGEPIVDPDTGETVYEDVTIIVEETVITPTPEVRVGTFANAPVNNNVRHAEYTYWHQGAQLSTDGDGVLLEDPADIGNEITVSGPTLNGTVTGWQLEYSGSTWSLLASQYEQAGVPDRLTFTGVVDNSLAEVVRASFTVTDAAYTPFPHDMGHMFSYKRQTQNAVDNTFTGEGADTEPELIFGEEYSHALPVAMLKSKDVWVDSNSQSDWYKTTDKLLRYVQMDLDTMVESIRKDTESSEVSTVAIRFGVDVLTKDPSCRRYIYDYFDYIRRLQVVSKADYDAAKEDQKVFNHYSIEEGSFNSTISMAYVHKTTGKLPTAQAKRKNTVDITTTDEDATMTLHLGDGNYSRLLVRKLAGSYVIRSKESGGKSDMAFMSLGETDDADVTQNFVVPIIRGVYYNLPLMVREEVRARSYYLVVFASEYTKIKWYKTAKFLNVIGIIIAVVVTILTLGTDGGSIGAAIAAAVASLATMAGIKALVIKMVVSYAISRMASYAIEKALVALGAEEWAAIVALVASAAAAYYGSGLTGKQMSWGSAVMHGTQATSTAYTKVKTDQLDMVRNDFIDFMGEYDEKSAENEEILNQLEVPLQAKLTEYLVESPEAFFGRVEADTTTALTTIEALNSIDIDHIFI